jgi:hypothetical protein
MKSFFLISIFALQSYLLFSQTTDRVADCEPPKASADLHVNNVRARIHSGGDMWWDLHGDPKYEIPKGSGSHSIFAGAIWMGGYDDNDQLHLMAQRFRQVGIDAFTGPLITSGAEQGSTDMATCREYDKIFELFREDVIEFRAWWECSQNPDCNTEEYFPGYVVPQSILNWPAHGPQGGYSYYLAPFYDMNDDGVYNPYDGDFPYYEFPEDDITDNPDCLDTRNLAPKLYGDQTLWWVYNDAGNEHTETGGEPLGVEIHAQAFAYADQGVLNDQTFYQYNLINRSTNVYHDFRVGLWTDVDVGGANDDYIGCDVERGLGYMYNGDDFDDDYQGNSGYGVNPPAVGFDFVSGLFQDINTNDDPSNWDTIDGVRVLDCSKADFMNGNINGQNFADGIVDNERWGMNHFIYLQTYFYGPGLFDFSASDYYNVLKSMFLDGSEMYYGGTGHQSWGGDPNVEANFMYPGNPTTDQCGWGQNGQVMGGWSEELVGNPSDDRRFVMSMEAITLQPGETNNFTVATIWARGNSGAYSSVEKLKKVDDVVQAMFDRCFRVLDGPDAPELNIVELDSKLAFHLYNPVSSNNYLEQYQEKDSDILCETDECDPYYRFQGYQVFQLKSKDIDFWKERYNTELVQEVFQCDIRDEIGDLVNYKYNTNWTSLSDQLEVKAENKGIKHSFVLTKDAFSWGDSNQLVNHKEMYFVVLAYAANLENIYTPFDISTHEGQKTVYLTSRKDPVVYSAIAHKPNSEQNGLDFSSTYGTSVEITQLDGSGNGMSLLELTDESISEIMFGSPWKAMKPIYKAGYGPVNIRIIDPLNVPKDEYRLYVDTASPNWSYGKLKSGAQWFLVNSSGDTVFSDMGISLDQYEQLIPEYGISIEFTQVEPAGFKNTNPEKNGFLSAEIQFADPNKQWLSFIPDEEGFDEYNWIRSGTYRNFELESPNRWYDDYIGYDPDEYFEDVLDGKWAPYRFTSNYKYGPAYKNVLPLVSIDKYAPISSIDLVITSDKSKWSRSIVLEMCENEWTTDEDGIPEEVIPLVNYRSKGNALRFDLRQDPSVDKEGKPLNDGTHGLGWFPGYAIDVRTGTRLNIAFGEDSWLVGENGDDMIWNPTENISGLDDVLFGGKHYIYVYGNTDYRISPMLSSPAYDSCSYIYSQLMKYEETDSIPYKKNALVGAMWTAIPILEEGHQLLETDVRIKIRVATPYYQSETDESVNFGFPAYAFSTGQVASQSNDLISARTSLDLIRVVPNPYYGYSFYQSSGTDKHVKITNLPTVAVIRVYNVGGQLIQQWDKKSDPSWIDWNLKDFQGNYIPSGMYLIHISAPDLGEKVVKWYAAMSE